MTGVQTCALPISTEIYTSVHTLSLHDALPIFTIVWGAVAVGFALGASLFENLIQAVNILGSIFYGPMLGVFLVGFFTKRVSGTTAFVAVVAAEAAVVSVWLGSSIGFLWYNVVGCAVVVAVSIAGTLISPRRAR